MTRIYIHSNGDAANHGCEAIIRTTYNMLKPIAGEIGYPTYNITNDKKYGIDKLVTLIPCKRPIIQYRSVRYFYNRLLSKINFDKYAASLYQDLLTNSSNYDVALSVGGDNYCYQQSYLRLAYINRTLKRTGLKSILWGASIEPTLLRIKSVREDLKKYDALFVRESETYNALQSADINSNVYLYPDPAFSLQRQPYNLPQNFIEGKMIGINISPLIQTLNFNPTLIIRNYENLIKYILTETDYNIALIPHVVWSYSDDRTLLDSIFNSFRNTNRIINVRDANCMQLKDCIARCSFFIGARTHATIAAYSSCVPTLAVGYTVKAKGIATDLFGTEKNYVLPVQEIHSETDVAKTSRYLFDHGPIISEHLKKIMPDYIKQAYKAGSTLCNLIKY